MGRIIGLRTVYLQEMSLLGSGWGGWAEKSTLLDFFPLCRDISKQSLFMSKGVFPDRLKKLLGGVTTVLKEKIVRLFL